MMVNWSVVPAVILPLAADKFKLTAVKGLTFTLIVLVVNGVPSLADIDAVSALYKVISPPALDTPLVKVNVSEVPKLTADGVLLVTVG